MELDLSLAQLIFESLDTLAIIDAKGKYIYVNRRWVDWMGLSPENVIGTAVKDIVPDSKIDLVIETKKPIIAEFLYGNISPSDGTPKIVTYYPIIKDYKVIAVITFSIFSNFEMARGFGQRLSSLTHELNYFKDELRKLRGSRYTVDNIIGESNSICRLRTQIYQAARSNSTVLIEGETGTGKELVAHAIHGASQRSAFNFIKINCAAIPSELLEAELFGYEEGAFTGAAKGGRRGKFEMAHMGSIFLDEINQMPMSLQPKLLRVLQEKEIDKVGGKGTVEVNVRVIAAANTSLKKMVEKGKFREDLYYRLNVMQIKVPSLRERKEDISLLMEYLVKKLNRQLGVEIPSITPAAIRLLTKYDWPGNVRELQNVLERAMNMAWGRVLDTEHFEWFLENKSKRPVNMENFEGGDTSLKTIKHTIEKEMIIETLKQCGGNKVLVAQKLNISRAMLYRKIKKFDIET